MSWPTDHLGATAVTYPGMGIRDHARVAIQMLSREVPERTVYAHTGWREVGGTWLYLHGGGAIGAGGTVEGIETRLDGALAGYILPEPPDGHALRESIRASLRLLDVAPDRVSVPLRAATYRAVLGATDHSLHLAGPTGVLKTELAALVQQHFGAAMDSRALPGSWSSTGNLLEAIAFAAKDAVLVVDDFAPSGSIGDVQRLHRDADRLLRAQGNSSGRGRMRADTSLRPAKPPRGLVLSTGEDVPHGQSLRARVLVIEVGPGDVNERQLTEARVGATVDPALWNAAARRRAKRATNTGQPAHRSRDYALRGVVVCAGCERRLIGDTGYYRHHQACEAFAAAARGLRRAPLGRSVSVPASDYDGVVETVLERLAMRADDIAKTVGGFRDAESGAVDAVALARIERERTTAMDRYRRDRDAGALERTMAALDRQEATARIDAPSLTPAEVREYLTSLPTLWQDAPTTRGRLAGSLWDTIRAAGTEALAFGWSAEAIALGIADGMPATATISVGSGRGERI